MNELTSIHAQSSLLKSYWKSSWKARRTAERSGNTAVTEGERNIHHSILLSERWFGFLFLLEVFQLCCDTIANTDTVNRTFCFDPKENLEYLEGPVFVIVASLAALFLVTRGISPPKANAASIRPELPIAYLKTPQCEGQGTSA